MPGPACYGRGGEQPTITDCNLVLGYLERGQFPRRPDAARCAQAAQRAVETAVAQPLGMSVAEAAEGIVRIIDVKMEEAIKAISTMRGHDLRDFMLLAFGGAGPLHAGRIARDLGMAGVIVPLYPGVYSAIGLLMSDVKHDYVRSRMTPIARAHAPPTSTRCSRGWKRRRCERTARRTALRRTRSASSARSTCAMPARATRSPCRAATRCSDGGLAAAARAASTSSIGRCSATCAPEEPVEIVSYRVRGIGLVPPVEMPQFKRDRRDARRCAARDARACASMAATSTARSISARGSTSALTLRGPGDPRPVRLHDGDLRRADRARGRMEESDRDGTEEPMIDIIDAVDLEVVKAEPLRHRAGDAELAVPHRLLDHRARIAGCLLRADERQRRGGRAARRAAAAYRRVSGLLRRRDRANSATSIAEGDAFLINHPYRGRQPARARHLRHHAGVRRRRAVRLLRLDRAQERHRRPGAGKLLRPGARDLQRGPASAGGALPARRQADPRHRAHHRRQQPHARAGAGRHPRPARRRPAWRAAAATSWSTKFGKDKILACFDAAVRDRRRRKLRNDDRRMGGRPLRGRALRRRRRRRAGKAGAHPRRRRARAATSIHFDFSGSADQTKGPANIRPPLVQAACAYCLISLIDPHMYVSQRAVARLHDHGARRQRAQSALPGAGEHLQSDRACAGRCGLRGAAPHRARQGARRRLRQPLDHPRRPQHLYRQGLRAIRDHRRRRRRARRARTAPRASRSIRATPRSRRSRSSKANSRPGILRFELIADSGGAGAISRRARHPPRIPQPRGRALLDPLDEARHPAERLRRRQRRPHRRYLDQSGAQGAPSGCRRAMPIIRSRQDDMFRLDTPGGGGYGDPLAREPERVLADVREGYRLARGGRARLRRRARARAMIARSISRRHRRARTRRCGTMTWTSLPGMMKSIEQV